MCVVLVVNDFPSSVFSSCECSIFNILLIIFLLVGWKFLAADIEKEYIRIEVYNFTEVWLFSFQFHDLEQVLCALCLRRSSPNLQSLKIEVRI